MATRGEVEMIDSLCLIKFQIIELNKKFESLLLLKKIVPGIPIEPALICRHPDHIWSIQFSCEYVLIKYNYSHDFEKFIKNVKFKIYWDKYLLGWLANREHHEKIYFQILEEFPTWECIDKRV
jgi:hypothetical protein